MFPHFCDSFFPVAVRFLLVSGIDSFFYWNFIKCRPIALGYQARALRRKFIRPIYTWRDLLIGNITAKRGGRRGFTALGSSRNCCADVVSTGSAPNFVAYPWLENGVCMVVRNEACDWCFQTLLPPIKHIRCSRLVPLCARFDYIVCAWMWWVRVGVDAAGAGSHRPFSRKSVRRNLIKFVKAYSLIRLPLTFVSSTFWTSVFSYSLFVCVNSCGRKVVKIYPLISEGVRFLRDSQCKV